MFFAFIFFLYSLVVAILAVCTVFFGLGFAGLFWFYQKLDRERRKPFSQPLGLLGIGGLGFGLIAFLQVIAVLIILFKILG